MKKDHTRGKARDLAAAYDAQLAKDTAAPVDIAIKNLAAQDQPVVYIGGACVLTLTLTNQTHTLTLKGASSVPPDPRTAETAAVYLDFGTLLDAKALAGLTVSGEPGWQALFLPGSNLWGLCPSADKPWAANAAVSITIGNILVREMLANAAVDVYYANFDQPGTECRHLKLLVQNPPGDKADVRINASTDPYMVLITPATAPPVANTIHLDLVNNQGVPLPAGRDTCLYVSFVYGTAPGYGALTERGCAVPIITVTEKGGDRWDVSLDVTGEAPFWILRPNGTTVLGASDGQNIAAFEIAGIVVPSDFVAGPTGLYVQWTGLPGYCDGHTCVVLQKQLPEPSVKLQAAYDIVPYGNNAVLTWQTVAVPHLQLSYRAFGKGIVFLPGPHDLALSLQSPDTASSKGFVVPDVIQRNTTFYLRGYKDAPPPGKAPDVAPIAEANDPVTVQHPAPTITGFAVTPAAWVFEFGPTEVSLSWNIDWREPRHLTLIGPDQNKQTLRTDATSQTVTSLSRPGKWTLLAEGAGGLRAQAEVEVKAQSVFDYLFRQPRRYKGTNNSPSSTSTVEMILTATGQVTINYEISYCGIDTPIPQGASYQAKVEHDMLVVQPPDSLNPLLTYHFKVTPGKLLLVDPTNIPETMYLPATLYEETAGAER